jgi:hypothetical protein
MPRGGRRPGAGAPRGNLNALRTGRHSARYKRLLEILSRDPEAIRLLEEITLGDRKRAERKRRGACPEPGASRSRRAIRVLNQVLQRMAIDALDRAIDEWERNNAIPASVLDTPNPAAFLRHRNTHSNTWGELR